ncbi:MAG TPA: hypothetical protein VG916_08915 [Gemmatimonadaceae bacterium]|nr:hypothetical protein [Gemmatimonadaceae bacterium]
MDRTPVRAAIAEWCAGRDWRWRALLLAFLAWQAARPLRDSDAWHVFRGITFGAHEFGHLFFALGGSEWMSVAGGSLMQLLVPVGAACAMIATPRKDWFGAVACGTWLAASLADLAPYIGDARAQALDLVSFSPDGGGHDWHYLLAHAGLLKQDTAIARGARAAAVVVLLATTAASVALFRRMARPAAPDLPPRASPTR